MSYEPSTMANTMRLPYTSDGTPMYTSISRSTPNPAYNNPNGGAGPGIHAGERESMAAGVDASGGVKRKRGRPRKYAADVVADGSTAVAVLPVGQGGGGGGGGGGEGSELFSPATTGSGKRPRGRPPGALNKQHSVALGSPGVGFMPHILDVKAGEDVLAKMMWFSQNSTRALCVLSANGAVSNVTLRQSETSGGTVTYEGNFEILSLSGSFMVSEVDGQRIRTGGISVALSGPDGRVLGGNLAGILTAASPVQCVVGTFVPSSQKQAKTQVGGNEAEVVNAPHSESSGGGLGSPFNHSNTNGNPQAMASMAWR
ncbi:putative AT-hook motif nuclear-localized protein [Helianthus annuus]|nr:putative AT-hook motif nuclear-localized protein [Helianthus annuus]